MTDWPRTIPYDLYEAMEAADHDAWRPAFRNWAKSHRLKLKLQWDVDLKRRLGELDQLRWAPKVQDRWTAMREWLVAHDVPVPDGLPRRPEQSTHR